LNISDLPEDNSVRVLVTLMALYMYHNDQFSVKLNPLWCILVEQ